MTRDRIAVTGVGVVCAIGNDLDSFTENLRSARPGIAPVRGMDTRWANCKLAAEVDDLGEVAESLIDGVEVTRSDLLAIKAASEALRRSGLDRGALEPERVGVSFGSCQNSLVELEELFTSDRATARRYAGSSGDAVAMAFGLTGPRTMTSNACAAGGAAITVARNHLWAGMADVMLAGGSDALEFFTFAGFTVLQSLDIEPCSPYGRSAGLTLGEGAGVLVLEPYARARARGATILAELAGCGSSADGYHPTAPDPTGRGAALALRRALVDSRIDPQGVDYVNGHGTGTKSNDAMERAAFRLVFGERVHEVPISSTKSMIGHTLGAAGVIEAAACIASLQHGFLPPTVNMPDDAGVDLDFVPNVSRAARVRVATSTNYAFGGSNCAIVLSAADDGGGDLRPAAPSRRVLLTGLGAVGPLGEGADAWASALREGRSGIVATTIEDTSGRSDVLGTAAQLLTAGRYAARADWRKMNDFERMCVASTRLAWNDAGLRLRSDELENVALVLASAGGALHDTVDFLHAARQGREEASPNTFPHTAGNAAAGHVCTTLGFHGPMLSFSQGGSSSLVGLEHARVMVAQGEVDVAVVTAGEELCHATVELAARRSWGDVSKEEVRPFDRRSSGTAFGSASVCLVLESEEHALARGAQGYAEVRSTALVGANAPARDVAAAAAWERAMRLALERADVAPVDVGYCAAAAGGDPELDMLELQALAAVLPASTAIGAPKSMTGDCLGAAAAINVLVAAFALRDGWLAPTMHLEEPLAHGDLQHVIGAAIERSVDYCLVNAATPGATYGSIVLGGVR